MRVASIDLGSNTFLCLIADVESNGKVTVIDDMAEVVRLGQGVSDTGIICEEALLRASSCLQKFANQIYKFKPLKVFAVATAAARNAKNVGDLIKLAAEFGIPVKVITGQLEAELTFRGSSAGLANNGNNIVIDIGGGSTEIIIGSLKEIIFRKSFNIGVVKIREKFVKAFPINKDIFSLIRNEIIEEFTQLEPAFLKGIVNVTAVAGTPTTLASIILGGYDPLKIEGYYIDSKTIESWQNILLELTPSIIEEKFFVQQGRSDVLAIGVIMLFEILKIIKMNGLTVSVQGLRFGLAEMIANKENEYES